MSRCIYCFREFKKADREHILQNFLGARWTSDTIVCNECQRAFSTTIDSALEEGLRPIRNLFGTRSGRGECGPTLKNLRASSGELLDLKPGFRPRLRQPIVTSTELSDGRHDIHLQIGEIQQAGWGLKMLREQVPQSTVGDDALRSLQPVESYVQGTVTLPVTISGPAYFRGVLKACFNLLGVMYPGVVDQPCFNAARDFIRDDMGTSQQFIRWLSSSARLSIPRLGPIDQALFIVSRDQSVEGVAQFFGDIVRSFQLSNTYHGESIHCGYVVDPFREARPSETREPNFFDELIPLFAEQVTENNSAVQAAFNERLSRILKVFYDRAYQTIVE